MSQLNTGPSSFGFSAPAGGGTSDSFFLADVSDSPSPNQNTSSQKTSNFLNVLVVRGGINMGSGESDANDDATTPQR